MNYFWSCVGIYAAAIAVFVIGAAIANSFAGHMQAFGATCMGLSGSFIFLFSFRESK